MSSTAAFPSSTRTRQDVLVSPQWLQDHLDDPRVRVLEVDVSATAFDAGHIPGATLWSIYRDLKNADFQLRDTSSIQSLLASAGISPATTVVVYGYAPAMAFWVLKLYRHRDVRILEGSREAWRFAGRPWTAAPSTIDPAVYSLPNPDPTVRALRGDVLAALGTATILDVRSAAEFAGERFWPSGAPQDDGRTGHIPSARHTPLDRVLDENGCYVSQAELRQVFPDVSGAVITYCAIGARAATAWFALTYLLGRDNVRVYDGSWADWGRNPTLPVALS